ncbi:MAG: AsnC family transcriptional regulator [Candidatus Nitrosopolaris sp.]
MDAKLDNTDIAIVKALIQDGRKSFRQIAREIKASTPTVEARFSRMKGLGIIKNIQPIFDIEKIDGQMSALVFVKTNLSQSSDIANKLASIPQVRGVYKMTGEHNIIIKVIMTHHPEYLEEFIKTKIANIEGIKSASYQMITKTIKDDQSIPVMKEGIFLKIKCDYCDNDIFKDAKLMRVGQYERYFCCNSCLTLYKQKYKTKIETMSR